MFLITMEFLLYISSKLMASNTPASLKNFHDQKTFYEIISSKIKMQIKCYHLFNYNQINVWKNLNIANTLSKNLPKVNIIIY